nr:hypothetical protein [Tanacetum cinerariifolium]
LWLSAQMWVCNLICCPICHFVPFSWNKYLAGLFLYVPWGHQELHTYKGMIAIKIERKR